MEEEKNTQMMGEAKIIHPGDIPWKQLKADYCEVPLYDRALVSDPETGMCVNISRYPKGFLLERHTHTCAHGMYILEGKLSTSIGMASPGDFVWFPAGMEMEHGATVEEDCVFLFITNRPFDIHYLREDSAAKS